MNTTISPRPIALIFDVFGTVVDWRTSIINECKQLGSSKNILADWESFADKWRGKYGPFMNKVRHGELPWTNLDTLHRMALDELLLEFDIKGFSEFEKNKLNTAWHRLQPWPDSVQGLTRLKEHYIIGTLSNGNVSLLVNMAKNAGLPWDCILSAELARAYKPDPQVYSMAVSMLGLKPEEVVMVAAHRGDLLAAQNVGLKTAFVPRPLEHGPSSIKELETDVSFDIEVADLCEMADELTPRN